MSFYVILIFKIPVGTLILEASLCKGIILTALTAGFGTGVVKHCMGDLQCHWLAWQALGQSEHM